eukprot:scaffold13330_cov67-Phaeocystis_antarctica.AAC.3
MPAVHVRGSFAFWQRGLPPHRIYPALSARMPAAVFQGFEGGGGLRARGAAKAGARAQCLVIELGAVHELQTSCPAANPYLVAELGGQQLLCQPLLGCEGPRAAFNQRFVVFLGAHAPPDGAKLRLRVMHKQVETPHGERQSVGGPPHIGSELAAELDEQLDRALSAAQAALRADWEAAREAKRASTGGTFSSLMSLLGFGGGSSAGAHEAGEAEAERPPPAPADLLLGEGEIELALALRQGGAAEVRVQLTQPVAELLRQRMLAEQLTSLFAPWAAAATAAEVHDLVPAGGDGDGDDDGEADADADTTERAAGWAHKVLATVQADLAAVKVPVGEARLSLSLFEWDERSLHVAQQKAVAYSQYAHMYMCARVSRCLPRPAALRRRPRAALRARTMATPTRTLLTKSTPSWRYAHDVYITCTCDAHAVHMRCTCGAHAMHMRCSCDAHAMHMRCTCDAHAMLMRCTCNAHAMHMRCSCDAHAMHMRCTCDLLVAAVPLGDCGARCGRAAGGRARAGVPARGEPEGAAGGALQGDGRAGRGEAGRARPRTQARLRAAP